MSKRVDDRQDATQEISSSQLMPNTPRPQIPRGNPQHDASMWMQTVVGSDDFAPAAKKKAAPTGRRAWVIPVLALAVLGAGAAGYWVMSTQTVRPSATPTAATTPPPATPPGKPMAVAAPAVAAPAAPAPAAAQPADAGLAAPTSPAMVVDAVSSVGAPIKKTTKKKVTKKKPPKKPAPKRR